MRQEELCLQRKGTGTIRHGCCLARCMYPLALVRMSRNCLLTTVEDEIRQDDSSGPIANESPPTPSPEPVAGQAELPDSEPMRPQFAESLSVTPLAPCNLISHLGANPSADITQIPILAKGTNDLDEREGVECSRAYQMLMPYGTTVAKLDNIALTLETGCRKNSSGGCSIRKDYMYKALDELQS